MKYLFIDFECSNCHKGEGKICEFGYVLTDENFNILKIEDRPISPGGSKKGFARFDTSIYKREPGFKWAYDIDTYYKSPEFYFYYPILKDLFTREDVRVVGFAFTNDMSYLNYTINRYKLDKFNFKCIDVKILIEHFRKENPNAVFHKLEGAYKYFYGEEEFKKLHSHKSSDDALMTMKILIKLIEVMNKHNVNELIEVYPDTLVDYQEFISGADERKRRKVQRQLCYNLWQNFANEYFNVINNDENKGKRITLSSSVKDDINLLNRIISTIKEKSLIPSFSINTSDLFLVKDEEDKNRLLGVFKEPFKGKMILLNSFINYEA